MTLTTSSVPRDSHGRPWGSPERPFAGFLDGWAVTDCGHVVRYMFTEPVPERCDDCGDGRETR